MEQLRALIREVPDFPSPGILFRDIMPLLADHAALGDAVGAMAELARQLDVQRVAAIESRGFLFGVGLSQALGCGLTPLRKPGKLPGRVQSVEYSLEYGTDRLQAQEDAFASGMRVLIVDDVLATGGTLDAAVRLVRQCGADPVAASVLIELDALGGRKRLEPLAIQALLNY